MCNLDRFPDPPCYERKRTALEQLQEEGYEPVDMMEDENATAENTLEETNQS